MEARKEAQMVRVPGQRVPSRQGRVNRKASQKQEASRVGTGLGPPREGARTLGGKEGMRLVATALLVSSVRLGLDLGLGLGLRGRR